MFEKILAQLAKDLVPRVLPQVLRSLADQIECGQIAFSEEAISQAVAEATASHAASELRLEMGAEGES